MNIRTYYDSLESGGRRQMADALLIAPTYLYQIVTGRRPVPARMCRAFERVTDGAVTVHDLRPDIFGPASGIPPKAAEQAAA